MMEKIHKHTIIVLEEVTPKEPLVSLWTTEDNVEVLFAWAVFVGLYQRAMVLAQLLT